MKITASFIISNFKVIDMSAENPLLAVQSSRFISHDIRNGMSSFYMMGRSSYQSLFNFRPIFVKLNLSIFSL